MTTVTFPFRQVQIFEFGQSPEENERQQIMVCQRWISKWAAQEFTRRICELHATGVSQCEIARRFKIDRGTVAKHLRQAAAQAA